VAVCESNLAVILHEFGDNRVDWANEASFLIDRSVETVDSIIERYEKEAMQAAAKMLGSGRAILPELPSSSSSSSSSSHISPPASSSSSTNKQLSSIVEGSSIREKGEEGDGNDNKNNKLVVVDSDGGGGGGGSGGSSGHLVDRSSLNDEKPKGGGAEEAEDQDEPEESPTDKKIREEKEALYMKQCMWDCLPEAVRIAKLILRHNKLRILTDQLSISETALEVAKEERSRAASANANANDGGGYSPPVSPLTQASFKSKKSKSKKFSLSFTEDDDDDDDDDDEKKLSSDKDNFLKTNLLSKDGDQEEVIAKGTAVTTTTTVGGSDNLSLTSSMEGEDAELKLLKEEQEHFLISCLELYENSPGLIRGAAGAHQPKLSKYIGMERLGAYPPDEFEVIYELRRQKIEQVNTPHIYFLSLFFYTFISSSSSSPRPIHFIQKENSYSVYELLPYPTHNTNLLAHHLALLYMRSIHQFMLLFFVLMFIIHT
jgi:hypothetical protein